MNQMRTPEAKRQALVEAAFRTLAKKGIDNTRLADIARTAGVAPSLLSYYFSRKDDLLLEATRYSIDRFYAEQVEVMQQASDPMRRLEIAVGCAMASGPDDPSWIVLYEFWTKAIHNSALRSLADLFYRRTQALFVQVIDDGCATGRWHPVSSPATIAQTVISIIDGLTLQVVLRYRNMDGAAVERIAIEYLHQALGVHGGVEG